MKRLRNYCLLGLTALALAAGRTTAQQALQWSAKLTNTGTYAFGLNPLNNDIVYTQKNGTFYVSHDRGETWETRGSCPQEQVRNISVSPIDTNSILLCSYSLWKSNDGGWTWREVLADVVLDGESIDYNYLNPATMYLADFYNSTFYVSTDTGSTWTARSTIGFGNVCTLSANHSNPDIIIAGAGDTRIARSTDAGFTWTLVKNGNPYFSECPKLVWDKHDSSVAYAAMQEDELYSVFKSTDYGASWFDIGMYGSYMWGMDQDPVSGDIFLGSFGQLFGGAGGINGVGVFRSGDQGRSWQRFGNILIGQPGEDMNVWMIKASNHDDVYILNHPQGFSNVGKILRLGTNGLGRLTGIIADSASGTPLPYAAIVVEETNDSVIVNNSDGHYTFSLGPGSYTLRVKVGGMQKTISNVTFAAGVTDTLNVTIPGNITYATIDGDVRNAQNDPIASEVTLMGTRGTGVPFMIKDTTDGSGQFLFPSLISLDTYDSLVARPLVYPYATKSVKPVSPGGTYHVVLGVADVLIVSNDAAVSSFYETALNNLGVSWSTWNSDQFGVPVPSALVGQTGKQVVLWFDRWPDQAMSSAEHDTLVVICDKGYNLLLAGQNLAELNQASSLFQNHLGIGYVADYTSDVVIRGFTGNLIGGGIFMSISLGLQPTRDQISLLNAGVHKALRYGTNLSDSNKIAAAYIDNTGEGGKAVFMGFDLNDAPTTNLRTLLQRSVAFFDMVVPVGNSQPAVPTRVSLMPNFPNPFNPSTTIRYNLDQDRKVTLTVYNALGQVVRTLVDRQSQSAGTYALQWDGRNDAGVSVSTGVYLYRLEAGSVVKTRKMLLMK